MLSAIGDFSSSWLSLICTEGVWSLELDALFLRLQQQTMIIIAPTTIKTPTTTPAMSPALEPEEEVVPVEVLGV